MRLGEWDSTSDNDCDDRGVCSDAVVDVPVAEAIAHEGYDPLSTSRENDIGIIRLQRKVRYSQFIRPICMPNTPTLRDLNFGGVRLTATGWGKTEYSRKSEVKLKANLNGMRDDLCASVYRSQQVVITKRHLCAGGEPGMIDTFFLF